MMSVSRTVWACVALVASSAMADPLPSTTAACDELASSLPGRVSTNASNEYTTESDSYWSTALREAKPACIVLPQSAGDVSIAVKVLNAYPAVQFAVKSGGHTPNARHSSVLDGVLISTKDLSGVTYAAETGLAHVKPGGEWNDVIGPLEEHGVTILGGRLGIVGVGGYLMQGGISFLSAQYGLAADNIVAWELVTSSGAIVNVTEAESPDLAVALRGSGNQLGIVTQFTVKTHKIGQVWGGTRMYAGNQTEDIMDAFHDYVPGGEEDTKSAIILTSTIAAGGTRAYTIFYFYDGPEPPTTGPFAKFLSIDTSEDTTSTQSYAELLKANGDPVKRLIARQSFRTATLPYLADMPGVYSQIVDKHTSLVKDLLPSRQSALCSVDFQPFPSVIGQHSEDSGGNAMGISGSDPHRVILELQCSWDEEVDDDLFQNATRTLVEWIDSKVPEWSDDGQAYLPLFMNDAAWDQNVTGTYKGYADFKRIQKVIDPTGFFPGRAGGFVY